MEEKLKVSMEVQNADEVPSLEDQNRRLFISTKMLMDIQKSHFAKSKELLGDLRSKLLESYEGDKAKIPKEVKDLFNSFAELEKHLLMSLNENVYNVLQDGIDATRRQTEESLGNARRRVEDFREIVQLARNVLSDHNNNGDALHEIIALRNLPAGLRSMSLPRLREECERRDLQTGGTRNVLISRIEAYCSQPLDV